MIASQKVVKRLFAANYLRKVAAKLQLGCYLNVIIQPSYEGYCKLCKHNLQQKATKWLSGR